MIARVAGALLLAFGALALALLCLAWALVSVALLACLPEKQGRRVGRLGAMHCFRSWLGLMEALGAWHLDLSQIDSLRGSGPLILAPNHPSLLDAVLIVSRLPDAVCVMKGSLLRNFLLAPAARLARYVPNDSLLRLISRAAPELALGGQLILFPEGTRTLGTLGAFSEAVGAVSRRTGVAVQTQVQRSRTAGGSTIPAQSTAFCAAIVPKCAASEPPLVYVNAAFCISGSFT